LSDLGVLSVSTLVDDGLVSIGAGATLAVTGTFADYGTLAFGTNAVLSLGAADVFLLSADAAPVGAIAGGGGTLELVAGTVATTGSLDGSVIGLSGFSDIVVGGNWSITNIGTIASAHTLDVTGVLTVSGTLVDAGTITVASGGTLAFGAGNDVLDLVSGAGLTDSGVIDGGAGINTLELSGAGTLDNFGGRFTNFEILSVDATANWTLGGSNTIAGTETLNDLGVLTVSTLVDDGLVSIGAGATLAVTGTFADYGTLAFGTGAVLSLGAADVFLLSADAAPVGAIAGGGGTLELVAGTVATTGSLDGSVIGLSGFSEIVVGGNWSITNIGTIASAHTLDVTGVLTVSGTLVDAGTITVASGGTLAFGAGNDVLDLVSGAGLTDSGVIDGGAGSNTLELSGAGTLDNFGGRFTNFEILSVDATADWTLGGSTTITGTETLDDLGMLTVGGTLVDDGVVSIGTNGVLALGTGTGVFVLSADAAAVGAIAGNGGTLELVAGTVAASGSLDASTIGLAGFSDIAVGGNWSIANIGTIASAQTLDVTGVLTVSGTLVDQGHITVASGGQLQFGNGGNLLELVGGVTLADSGVISGGAGTDTLELTGTAGVLDDFGGSFTSFEILSVAANAAWTLGGSNTIAETERLFDLGSLAVGGAFTAYGEVSIGAAATLTVDGKFSEYGYLTIASGGVLDLGSSADVFNLNANATLLAAADAVDGDGGTLELSAGAATGAFSGFNSSLTNFHVVEVDLNADWRLTGDLTLATGQRLINSGLLEDPVASGTGIAISGGGYFDNALGSRVTASGDGGVAVVVYGTAVNAGAIYDGAANGVAIEIGAGGTLVNQASGAIRSSGSLSAGLVLYGDALAVNYGTVLDTYTATAAPPVIVTTTGAAITITQPAGVLMTGAGTLVNHGTIAAAAGGAAIELANGGAATNVAGGVIEASSTSVEAVYLLHGATLANAGMVGGTVGAAVLIGAGGGFVTNQSTGTIEAIGVLGRGVDLAQGGTLVNVGEVIGTGIGAFLAAGGSIVNSGEIEGTGAASAGIYLYAGGSVTNSGLIEGAGVGAYLRGGSLTNTGNVKATGSGGIGLELSGGAVALNASGALIDGATGVELVGGGAASTLINAGMIESLAGPSGYAVVLGAADDVLQWDAGATFYGVVLGGGGTLDLAAGPAATGTLSGLGVSIAHFSLVHVGQNAEWELAGTDTLGAGYSLTDAGMLTVTGTLVDAGSLASSGTLIDDGLIQVAHGVLTDATTLGGTGTIEIANFGTVMLQSGAGHVTFDFTDGTGVLELADPLGVSASITGFMHGDTIDLTGLAYSSADSITYSNGRVFVYDAGVLVADLALSGLPAGATVALQSDGNGGTDIIDPVDQPPCFLRGTLIRTERGERPVEALKAGDRVVTLAGRLEPIRWIGRRRYLPAEIEIGRAAILPIVIARGALGGGAPFRDLSVSPEHCLYLGAGLIPARFLVNGASIVQRATLEPVEYFHIELERHGVIFADGAAAETYRENAGNRAAFENGRGMAARECEPCAPLVWGGVELDRIRRALAAEAAALGFATTDDPGLVLVADGVAVAASAVEGDVWRFSLPAAPATLRLVSRASVPAWNGRPDQRRLGINLARVVLRAAAEVVEVAHDDPILVDGFHEAEPTHRWTDGDAAIPPALLARLRGPVEIEIHALGRGLTYWAAA
jgi:hypothetical protein